MRKLILITLTLLFILFTTISSICCNAHCTPAVVGYLPVTLHPQETGDWCWAASGQMVMDYLGHDVLQCVQANNRFGRTDCCSITLCPTDYTTGPCVNGGWPEFDKYGFTFHRTNGTALAWEELREQISDKPYCEKKPFAFTWAWPEGGGHVMVAQGYVTLNGVDYVMMLNPWAPCVGDFEVITYDYYVESTGHHTHWDDFFDVTYVGE